MKIGTSKPVGSSSAVAPAATRRVGDAATAPAVGRVQDTASVMGIPEAEFRSEEHTSELQSH